MRATMALSVVAFLGLSSVSQAADDPIFTAINVRLDHPVEGDVVTAPLTKEGKQELLLRGKESESALSFFTILSADKNGDWQNPQSRRIDISKDAVFFDILSQGEGKTARLAVLTHDAIHLLNSQTGESDLILPTTSIYRHGGNPDFKWLDFARDVNGDGLDDFIIPDFDHYRVFLQRDGGFEPPLDLPFGAEMRIGYGQIDEGNAPRYQDFPLHIFDANLDDKDDIVFIKGTDFVAFEQKADGSFHTTPKIYPIVLDVVGNTWAEERAAQDARANESNYAETRIKGIDDFDGDGVVDILTLQETVRGTFDRTALHNIHFGRKSENGLSFEREADTSIMIEGIVPLYSTKDITGDEKQDGMFASADFGIGKIIGILLTRSTKFDLSFFEMGADRRFQEKANIVKKLSVDFDFSTGAVAVPVFMTADVTGDGRADLILNDKERGITVFPGLEDERLFEKRGLKFTIDLPKDGQLVRAVDVNGDDRHDLIIRFDPRGQDGADNSRRLILLMANGAE